MLKENEPEKHLKFRFFWCGKISSLCLSESCGCAYAAGMEESGGVAANCLPVRAVSKHERSLHSPALHFCLSVLLFQYFFRYSVYLDGSTNKLWWKKGGRKKGSMYYCVERETVFSLPPQHRLLPPSLRQQRCEREYRVVVALVRVCYSHALVYDDDDDGNTKEDGREERKKGNKFGRGRRTRKT